MANAIFKGFKQVTTGFTSFEAGYIYFVRTDENKEDGYVYFNGKKYGTSKSIENLLGALPEGYKTWAEYISAIAAQQGQLEAKVNGEISARTEADAALDERIDALEALTANTATKDYVDAEVAKEVSARTDADTALDGKISAEKTRAEGKEGELQDAITAEENRAKGVESGLDNRIKVFEADGAHDVAALEGRVGAAESDIDNLEASAHTHANKATLDGINDTKVAAWDDAAASAHTHANKAVLDGISETKVAAWDAAEQNAKDYADDKVADEISARTDADAALDNRIKAIEGDYLKAADKTELQDAITAEENRAKGVENGLDERIDALESAALSGATKQDVEDAKEEAIDASKVTMTTGASSGNVAKTYIFSQNGEEIGKVELAKDMVVESGEVITKEDGEKYLRLYIANSESFVDIAVKDLAHVYSQGNGIEISDSDVISAKVVTANGLSLSESGIAMGLADDSNNGAMSAADFTKLKGIQEGAEVNVQADWNQDDNTKDDFIKNKPQNLVQDDKYKHIDVTSTSVTDGTNTFEKYDDTVLAERVSTIEADYLKAADKTALETAISDEATARENADDALDNRIKAVEDDYLKAADKTELQAAITAEENRAKGKEGELQDAIDAEEARAKGVETGLDERIDALESAALSGATKQDVEDAKEEAIDTAAGYTDTKISGLSATVTGKSNDVEVTVTETEGKLTAATAKVNLSETEGNIIKSNTDGLFAAIYYEDLDA